MVNTEEQKKLGIDIQMIGAREKELGRTRSQTKTMMSPRNESMERAELTMEDWIHETCLISAVPSGPTEPKTFQEARHSPVEEESPFLSPRAYPSVTQHTFPTRSQLDSLSVSPYLI